MELTLDLSYSQAQNKIFFGNLAKFNIITKGRRFGLTRGAAQAFVEWAADGVPYMLWGDTINGNIDRYYERYFLPILNQLGRNNYRWNAQKRELKIFNSHIDFRSADKPENWEGFGYKRIFLNEAGIILHDPYLYDNAVLPMMMDYEDSILIAAGVPKGRVGKDGEHKFFTLFDKAIKDTTGRYRALQFSSYDNPFLPVGIVKEMEQDLDSETAKQEIHGQFIELSMSSFCYAYSEAKHFSEPFDYNPAEPLRVVFDFNKDPLVCYVAQIPAYNTGYYDVLNEYSVPNGDIDALCAQVVVDYPDALYFLNGDATGRNALTGNLGYYTIIRKHFRCSSDQQILVSTVNPSVKNTRVLCNSLLQNGHVRVHPRCKKVNNDLKYVQVKDDGSIQKDRSTALRESDYLDCFRYDTWESNHKWLKIWGDDSQE